MQTVLSIIGTRPEAIKMAPVVHALAQRKREIKSIVCSTGQHRELLTSVYDLFQIQPDITLDVMTPNQSLAGLTARLMEAIDRVVVETQPDWVLGQGDTTSVMVASLVAFYRHVKFGHIEAGLRTGDLEQPFPEELNRRIADEVSTLLFAPTEPSRRTLLNAGIDANRILLTGNTVVDALQWVLQQPYDWQAGPLAGVPQNGRLVLVTTHRRESFGAPMREVCAALKALAERFAGEGLHLVFPVHPNPNVQETARAALAGLRNVHLLEPLDYRSLVQVMRRSTIILTDSGGIQEEAPGLGVPVLVLRDTTERPEGVTAGVAKLVGTDQDTILSAATKLLTDESARQAMCGAENPYGDGQAARRIVEAICGSKGS